MTRVHNFSAGPAALPEPVLQRAAAEMLDWHGSGMSVMEMSHRGPQFMAIMDEALASFRELLNVPAAYRVLFMQGGALGSNAFVPMNLLGDKQRIDFIDTGEWSKKTIAEARKYATVNVAASSAASGYTTIPPRDTWQLDPHAAYVHLCANETIGGVEWHSTPDVGNVPLVADVSSTILSRPLDVSRFGLIYGGAQKNIGPAGLTIVVVHESLLGRALPITPSAFDFQVVDQNGSMYNTPPTYTIYIAGLVFQWIKAQGGLPAMERRNAEKAALLYDTLDASGLFTNTVDKACRSRMNVTFTSRDDKLDASFVKGADARGLVQLKGHRVVGGMRASIYNAMPLEGVQALVAYMKEFEAQHG